MENSNIKIINEVTNYLEGLEDVAFAKVWNVYCNCSIGIAEAKREHQYIKTREDLYHKKDYDYNDAMFALAQDICIYFHKNYEWRTLNGKPLLDSSLRQLTSGYKPISCDEFLGLMTAQI